MQSILYRWQRGWSITKNSLALVSNAKSLILIPVLGLGINLLLLTGLFTFGLRAQITGSAYAFGINPIFDGWSIIAIAIFYFAISIIHVFLAGVIAHNVLSYFFGEPISLAKSFSAAWKRRFALASFGAVASAAGYVLTSVIARLPLAGKIVVISTEASWTAANFFSVPIIMLADKNVSPKKAVVQSVKDLKSLWKEGIVSHLSLGFMLLTGLGAVYLAYVVILNIFDLTIGVSIDGHAIGIILLLLGIMFTFSLFDLVSVIARCALLYYLRNNRDPISYDLSVVKTGMTVGRARKLFL